TVRPPLRHTCAPSRKAPTMGEPSATAAVTTVRRPHGLCEGVAYGPPEKYPKLFFVTDILAKSRGLIRRASGSMPPSIRAAVIPAITESKTLDPPTSAKPAVPIPAC